MVRGIGALFEPSPTIMVASSLTPLTSWGRGILIKLQACWQKFFVSDTFRLRQGCIDCEHLLQVCEGGVWLKERVINLSSPPALPLELIAVLGSLFTTGGGLSLKIKVGVVRG